MIQIEQHGPAAGDRYTQGRMGTTIDRVVLHTMVGWISQADATFKGGSRAVSAHYGVRVDGTIWQWVQEQDTAWQAGDWDFNLRSIGIEHEDGGDYNGVRPEVLYNSSAILVRDICTRYGIPMDRAHIVRHNEVPGVATACPDALDTDKIIALANTKPAPGPDPSFAVLGPSKAFVSGSEWANLYKILAPQVGIRAEVAYAQAMKETNDFQFTGIARPEWNNPAGLGVTGAAGVGNSFASKELGVRAHLGHLLWYFGPTHPVQGFCEVDPRHFGAHKNYSNDIRLLDGHWAVPGAGYGESIAALANSLPSDRSDSDPVTWGDLKALMARNGLK